MPEAGAAARGAPPGPRGLALLRTLPGLWKQPLSTLSRLARDHGDVVRLRLGKTVYLLNHPDHAHQVLQERQAKYTRSFLHRAFKSIGGEGLITSEGQLWLRQRRLAQPAFHKEKLAGLAGAMARRAGALLDGWERAARGGAELEATREMFSLTLTIAGETLFGADLSSETDALRPALRIAMDAIDERISSALLVSTSLPTPANLRFRRAMRELDRVVQALIDDRRAGRSQGNDVLGMLVAARDEETGQGMDDRQLRDEVVTLLIAGHETTASSLAWALYLLARHPDVQEQLHAEVSRALQGRAPTAEELRSLPYVSQVIQETLRLYPPGFLLSRTLAEEDEVGGYLLPAGETVLLCTWLLHRLPAFWEEPEAFRPERFTPERAQARHRGAYLPFGAGARQCIGNQFTLMEMTLVLALIAQRFRVDLASDRAVEPEAALSLRPGNGIRFRLQPRA